MKYVHCRKYIPKKMESDPKFKIELWDSYPKSTICPYISSYYLLCPSSSKFRRSYVEYSGSKTSNIATGIIYSDIMLTLAGTIILSNGRCKISYSDFKKIPIQSIDPARKILRIKFLTKNTSMPVSAVSALYCIPFAS